MIYHDYIFFTGHPSLHSLTQQQLQRYKKDFVKELKGAQDVIVYSYSMLGLKDAMIFMLWLQADSVENLQDFLSKLMHTELGKHLHSKRTLFGMTRPTQYSAAAQGHNDTQRKGGKYLIIYPFTKTKEWHLLSFEKRKTLMQGHMAIGRNFPQISQVLLYSYGVDDSEFIVSYECDNLQDFQKLVMDLRSDKVRAYTLSDTPIFTCIYKSFEETMEYL